MNTSNPNSNINTTYDDNKENSNSSSNTIENKKIKNISIETMFYPKFYDYHEKKLDMNEIKKDTSSSSNTTKYYLELSIKHSGSLLLWNGYHYIYSKNSMDNIHTLVGHVLLLKHFNKVWNNNTQGQGYEKFMQCSDYLQSHNLSIQFEMITKGYLGHHGSLPCEDYLIVIGISDTKQETYWNTWDIIHFCMEFKLPHNEYWISLDDDDDDTMDNPKEHTNSLENIVSWYETSWEDMYYFSTIDYLNSLPDHHHITSIYPHDAYQGQLLEGLVVRYVPYNTIQLYNDGLLIEDYIMTLLHKLSHDNYKHQEDDDDFIINLTELFTNYDHDKDIIEGMLRDSLCHYYTTITINYATTNKLVSPTRYYFQKVNEAGMNGHEIIYKISSSNVVQYNNKIDQDKQTTRLIQLFHYLNGLNILYNFRIFRDIQHQNDNENVDEDVLYCMIHVPFDKVYNIYNNRKSNDMITLCRGFCIKIILVDDVDPIATDNIDNNDTVIDQSEAMLTLPSPIHELRDEKKFYMIKLKFLPYIIRTIACRQGIHYTLKDNNLNGYEIFVSNLLKKKWNISYISIQKYYTFLLSWGKYIINYNNDNDGKDRIKETNYLYHFEKFNKAYESGELLSITTLTSSSSLTSSSDIKFNGVLFIIGPNISQIKSLSKHLMKKFNCINANTLNMNNDINEITILNSLMLPSTEQNTGRICTSVITQNIPNKHKSLLKKYKSSLYVLCVGCTDDELNEYALSNEINEHSKEYKKLFGLCKSWRNRKDISLFIDLSSSSYILKNDTEKEDDWIPQGDEIQTNVINTINEYVINTLHPSLDNNTMNDKRIGALLFYPGIPGCCKSTLSNYITKNNISNILPTYFTTNTSNNDPNDIKDRQIIINSTDNPKTIIQKKEKYWNSVLLEKISLPSSIYICDKNSPPNIWSDIGSICNRTNSIAFCIIPSGKAFITTEVKIRKFNNNTISSSISSYGGNDVIYYPFSLHYLSFCIYNVLKRTSNDDNSRDNKNNNNTKRLDANNEEFVCMTIIKFFSFYKNLTAEKFIDLFITKMQKESAMYCPTPIYVPIFKSGYTTLPLLPYEIESVLRDALKLQFDIDTKQQQGNKRMHAESKQDMEYKLRDAFHSCDTSINALFDHIVQKEDITKASFLSQITDCLTNLDDYSNKNDATDDNIDQEQNISTSSTIKYVSIDIPVEDIYQFLASNYNSYPAIQEFFEQIDYKADNIPKPNSTGNIKGYRIYQTHVTMSHYASSTQSEMKTKYSSLENMKIKMHVNNFYFSKRIAALGVTVSSKTMNEPYVHVPHGTNDWMHITLWCGKDENTLMDVEKKESNDLPKLCLVNKAREVRFRDPGVIHGTLKMFMMDV